jgi:hypothetical protein
MGYPTAKYGLSSLKKQRSDLQSKIPDFYYNYLSIPIRKK